MHKYRLISKKGEGTFSEVLKAQSIKSGKHVAIKCMKNHFDSIDQVNNLREIQALRRLAGHPNIIKLHEVLYDEPTGRLALVFELMDMNLYEAIKGRRHYLPEQKVKQYMYELMKALDHMHRNGIFHRDVKPENLLLLDDEIKLADLGSCRGIYSRQPYTEYISTRWYRAPECLLTDGFYNFKMDLFAAGCVWFETVALFPLFPGQNEMDQIQKIHNVLGTPDPEVLARKFKRNASHLDFNFPEKKGCGLERLLPHTDPVLIDLIKKLIRYDPDQRILARQVLKDSYFKDVVEADKERNGNVSSATSFSRRGSMRNRDVDKDGTSVSNSTASIEPAGEATNTASQPHTPSGDEREQGERGGGGLPAIRQERRKGGAAAGAEAVGGGGNAGNNAVGGVNADRHRTPPGGGAGDHDEPEEERLLPPIGGGNNAHKASKLSFKAASTTSLQKPSMSMQTTGISSQGMLSNSKGFTGSLTTIGMTSMTSAGHTTSHPWVNTRSTQDLGRGDMGSRGASGAAHEKMSSTWAPSQQSRKDVSPFAALKLTREPGKKR